MSFAAPTLVTAYGGRVVSRKWTLLALGALLWASTAGLFGGCALAASNTCGAVNIAAGISFTAACILACCAFLLVARLPQRNRLFLRRRLIALTRFGTAFLLLFSFVAFQIGQVQAARNYLQDQYAVLQARGDAQTADALAKFPDLVRVVAYPETKQQHGKTRNWVSVSVLDNPHIKLRVLLPATPPIKWAPGTMLQMAGTVQFSDLNEPAAGTVYADTMPVPVTSQSSKTAVAEVIQNLLAQLQNLLAKLRTEIVVISEEYPKARLVPGFAVGDTQLVTPELAEQMRKSGLMHLVAVSGSNCALIAAAGYKLLAVLGCARRVRLVASAVFLCLFALLVGPDPSLLRATVMAMVLLISRFGGQQNVGAASLGAAMLLLLLLDPWQALNFGFGLSVLATAGILFFASPITRFCQKFIPKLVALPLAVTVAAQISCMPLLVVLQEEISVAAVLANLLAAPVAPLITGAGLIITLLIPLLPQAAEALLLPTALLCSLIEKIAAITVALPGSVIPWPGGATGAILVLLLQLSTAFICLIWQRKRRRKRANPWLQAKFTSGERKTVAALTAVSLFIFLWPGAQSAWHQQRVIKDWAIVACDVGQGDALLLRNPEHPAHTLLVDTGDNPEKLKDCLQLLGVTELTAAVLTHDDRDHIGAAATALQLTSHVVIAPQPDNQQRALLQKLQNHLVAIASKGQKIVVNADGSITLQDADANTTVTNDESLPKPVLTCSVLSPGKYGITEKNAASLVLHCNLGTLTALLLADTGQAQQEQLLQTETGDFRADVVKVAHHGSKDFAAALAPAIQAKYALFSVGAANSYGHPSKAALENYAAAGSTIFRTDLHGTVAISATGSWSMNSP